MDFNAKYENIKIQEMSSTYVGKEYKLCENIQKVFKQELQDS